MLEAIILTVITAATPLLLAAIGELVVERSGVLNLGVEGMMVMGAVAGFAVTNTTGSPLLGVLGGMLAGAAISLALRLRHADAGRQPGRLRPGADALRPRPLRAARREPSSARPASSCRASTSRA